MIMWANWTDQTVEKQPRHVYKYRVDDKDGFVD